MDFFYFKKKIEKEYVQTVRIELMLLKHLVVKGKRKKEWCLSDQKRSLEDSLRIREISKELVDKRKRFEDWKFKKAKV